MQAIGIIQEQHPERTLLFNQWKQLSMDLIVDPLNALDVSGVPIVLLVDQQGTIRYRNPKPEDVDQFLHTDYSTNAAAPAEKVPGQEWKRGDGMVLSGKIDQGIDYYRGELNKEPDDARLYFRLGVALRMRYDSVGGAERDFSSAVSAWREARERDPNQYIWRRRIQQYGPVLDKPYPFYGWVEQARREIRQRGEEPLPLSVEPTGAELAEPSKTTPTDSADRRPPDPEGKLFRDGRKMVKIRTLVVPTTDAGQRAARIHILLSPDILSGFAWNNEAEPLQVWVNDDGKCQLDAHLLEVANPTTATSEERRTLELEVSWPEGFDPSEKALTGYAVYNVCDKQSGQCMIRRQDFNIRLAP